MSDQHIERLAASVERILERVNRPRIDPDTGIKLLDDQTGATYEIDRPVFNDFVGLAIAGEQLRRHVATHCDTADHRGEAANLDPAALATLENYKGFLTNYEFIDADLDDLVLTMERSLWDLQLYARRPMAKRIRISGEVTFPDGENILADLEETISVIAAVQHGRFPDPEEFLCDSGIDEMMRAVAERVKELDISELGNFAEKLLSLSGGGDPDVASVYSFLEELAEFSDGSIRFWCALGATVRSTARRDRLIDEVTRKMKENNTKKGGQ